MGTNSSVSAALPVTTGPPRTHGGAALNKVGALSRAGATATRGTAKAGAVRFPRPEGATAGRRSARTAPPGCWSLESPELQMSLPHRTDIRVRLGGFRQAFDPVLSSPKVGSKSCAHTRCRWRSPRQLDRNSPLVPGTPYAICLALACEVWESVQLPPCPMHIPSDERRLPPLPIDPPALTRATWLRGCAGRTGG
jgi:hypothetical protein